MMGFHDRFELLGLSGYRKMEAAWITTDKKG
jgi:hypothetical protein